MKKTVNKRNFVVFRKLCNEIYDNILYVWIFAFGKHYILIQRKTVAANNI